VVGPVADTQQIFALLIVGAPRVQAGEHRGDLVRPDAREERRAPQHRQKFLQNNPSRRWISN
jgi:hypothetical protein